MVRIYDVFFDYNVLLSTDQFVREVSARDEFQRPMSSAEYHYLLGGYVREREKALGLTRRSVLAAAHELEVPIYTSSPGDSSIGMNVAEQALAGSKLRFDVSADVNETAAIVLEAKRTGGKSGVLIVGGGSPKNFMLQTEPQIQEVLGIDERGHDYFLQMTDARPDTGGLSGATPAEAVSWGKIDPDQLPGTVVVYGDNSIALPVLTAYAKARHADRPLKRLFGRREAMMNRLLEEYRAALEFRDRRAEESLGPHAPGSGWSGDGGAEVTPRYRWYALGLLTLINLLNYIDRNVIYALFESIKQDLALTDAQLGWLGSAYILVFSVAALPVRRHQRPALAPGGDRLGRVRVERVHLPQRAGAELLAALHLPRGGGSGRGRLRPGRGVAGGGLLPRPPARDGDGHPGLGRLARWGARPAPRRIPRGDVRLAGRLHDGWRARIHLRGAGRPAHRSDPSAGQADRPLLPARFPHRRDVAAPAALAAGRQRRDRRHDRLLARPVLRRRLQARRRGLQRGGGPRAGA